MYELNSRGLEATALLAKQMMNTHAKVWILKGFMVVGDMSIRPEAARVADERDLQLISGF